MDQDKPTGDERLVAEQGILMAGRRSGREIGRRTARSPSGNRAVKSRSGEVAKGGTKGFVNGFSFSVAFPGTLSGNG